MLRRLITDWLAPRLIAHGQARKPDFVVGGGLEGERVAYLLRWYLIPRNPVFNVYLHHFLRSDDDRALHDHMYVNLSVLLAGAYTEQTIAAGGIKVRTRRVAGEMKLRPPHHAHRIELSDGPCWTLFITGPRVRAWGFHCPEQGWVPWEEFTAAGAPGEIGKGCGG